MSRLLGAVLAGGASSRFGADKALALLDGERLLDLAMRALATVTDDVVVIGRAGGVADAPGPGLGPLGGIAGALRHAKAGGFDRVLTAGCDMPRLPGSLLRDLLGGTPRYCRDAPILGHWPAAAGPALIARLVGAGAMRGPALSVRRWAEAIGGEAVPAPAGLLNVNTPADLPAS